MQKSQAIARVVGPVFAAVGTGMLASGPAYRDLAQQFVAGYPFIYFSGVLLLVAGLAILNAHHDWTPDWRSSITRSAGSSPASARSASLRRTLCRLSAAR